MILMAPALLAWARYRHYIRQDRLLEDFGGTDPCGFGGAACIGGLPGAVGACGPAAFLEGASARYAG